LPVEGATRAPLIAGAKRKKFSLRQAAGNPQVEVTVLLEIAGREWYKAVRQTEIEPGLDGLCRLRARDERIV